MSDTATTGDASPQALRREFPIFTAVDGPFHYLDNAATGQICRAAAEAAFGFETRSRANVKRGVYRLADQATNYFTQARHQIATYINARHADEVVFTTGTTLGINVAARGLAARLAPGDVILSSELEHHSNIVPWQLAAAERGAVVRALPVTEEGRLDLDRLEDFLDERVKVVALTHCSNVTGAVTDVARVVAAAKAVGAIVLLDGAQRAPHGPLDVQALNVDLYAFSGHKMFGPTGGGVLWGRRELLDELPPLLGGGEMIARVSFDGTTFAKPPHRFEAGTPAIGPAIGMGAAAAWLQTLPWEQLGRRELALTERMLTGLNALQGVRVLGPQGLQGRIGTVAFEVDGVHAHDVCQMVDASHGVALRGGHHCAQPLMERFDLVATARASLAPYNDERDIDALLEGLEAAIGKLR